MSHNRSMLIISGNSPKRLQDASVFNPDLLVLDIADQVSNEEKDSARLLVKEAISFMDYENVKIVVRINTLESGFGAKDIEVIAKVKPTALMVPQANADLLQDVERLLDRVEKEAGIEQGKIQLFPVVETAKALEDVSSILSASTRVAGVFFNADGLAKELGITRTKEGEEILYARSKVALACHIAGLDSFDTPYNDGNDLEGLEQDATKAHNLGFSGKAAINGRQIDIIHRVFA
ncbi:HpcH/HpaI aldolase/citrate lyase family protein [Desulfitobacterium metallireducens]|uniref:Citryl-CoA lyase n=1 Tax=Desulfitobacterium metallireducens DSM 15288 TaxID=871968 RepID=W0E5F3_9FIRM|nr:aldolase/citrate lyase family protein [Desulfitobacterium metallireducens]AHF05987.1 citryl-CoA lyase [Desulfitobacterium metallireducens DSM 15288]